MVTSPGTSVSRKAGALLILPLLLLAAACSDDGSDASRRSGRSDGPIEAVAPDGFAATPSFLRTTAERSTGEAYQYELWMSLTEPDPTSGPSLATGAQDGERFAMQTDLFASILLATEMMSLMFGAGESGPVDEDALREGMMSDMPADLSEDDFVMESVGDSTGLYMRMPYLDKAPMDDLAGDADIDLQELHALGVGKRWGYIDLTRAEGIDREEIQAALAEEAAFAPAELIDVVANAEDVQELDPIEVLGEPVTGLTAEVGLGDLAALSGEEPEPGEEDVSVPMSVWVDEDGYLRRINYGLSFEDLEDPGESEDIERDFGDAGLYLTVDLFGYGEPAGVELPTDYVDVTEAADVLLSDVD